MDVFTGLLFVVVFLISYILLDRFKNLPPGPISLPFVGSIFFIPKLRLKRPHLVFAEAAKQYGDVMKFWFGPQLVVVLNGYDAVHEALVEHADVFSGRPLQGPLFKRAFPEEDGKGKGVLFNDYNHTWRSLRRFTLQVLRDFGVGKTSIEEKILAEVEAVASLLAKTEGTPIKINTYLQNVITNVIFSIIFGKRYDYDDAEFKKISAMTGFAIRGGLLSPSNFLPRWISKRINKQDVKRLDDQRGGISEMRRYVLQQIADHESTFDKNHIRDFIDLYISNTREGSEKFEKEDILRVINDLFLAGSETSSTTLDWAILYMSEYPDVQQRCQKEMTGVFGDKIIGYADRVKLVYVEATLLEIQRLATIVPRNVPHCTTSDTVFRGYNIPKGAMVLPTIYSTSHDTKYFKDPEVFRPERFISQTGKLMKNEALIPFSTGPRQCLGEPLAKMELFLVFTNLLQRFTFEPEDKAVKHSFESVMFQITNTPQPYKVRVYKRI